MNRTLPRYNGQVQSRCTKVPAQTAIALHLSPAHGTLRYMLFSLVGWASCIYRLPKVNAFGKAFVMSHFQGPCGSCAENQRTSLIFCLYVTNPLAIVDTAKTQTLPTTSVYSARFKYAQLEIKDGDLVDRGEMKRNGSWKVI